MSNLAERLAALANEFEEVCEAQSLRAMIWWHLRFWAWWVMAVIVGMVKEPVSFTRSFIQGVSVVWRAYRAARFQESNAAWSTASSTA